MDASTNTSIRVGRTVFSNILTKQVMINNGSYKSAATLTAGNAGTNLTPLYQATGGVNTLPTEFNSLMGFAFQPPPVSAPTGSYFFPEGSNFGTLTATNSTDFSLGIDDFTIEWWQYLQNPNAFPRVFSMGSYDDAITIAVSIEDDTFYFWMNQQNLFSVNVSVLDTWAHFAVVRYNSVTSVYLNGIQIGDPVSTVYNLIDTKNTFVIGNESTPTNGAAFTGYLTNFRMVKGTAVYTGNFTPSRVALTAIPGTVLLLLGLNPSNITKDSSSVGRTLINSNVAWSGETPFT